MTNDEVKKRFTDEIKLRAYDDNYVDRNEEREILRIAIELGVDIDSARSALIQVCAENNYVLETTILKQIREHIRAAVGDDGMIDRREFDQIFAAVRGNVQGKKNDREVKRLIVQTIEDTGNRVKTGWFRDWYAALKKELGT